MKSFRRLTMACFRIITVMTAIIGVVLIAVYIFNANLFETVKVVRGIILTVFLIAIFVSYFAWCYRKIFTKKAETVNDKFVDLKKTLNIYSSDYECDLDGDASEDAYDLDEDASKTIDNIEPYPSVETLKTQHLPKRKKASSVLETMVYNMAQMQNYYEISMMQAKNSYICAVIASCAGIAFFIFASVMVIFCNASISSVIIPAAGGALTEVIAGTIFIIYKKSLDQMNHYFDSLERNEKFLSSVNLVDMVSAAKRDAIYCEIIRSRLDGAVSKQ